MSSTSIAPAIVLPSPRRAADAMRLWGGEVQTVQVASGPWRLTRRGRVALLAFVGCLFGLLAVVGISATASVEAAATGSASIPAGSDLVVAPVTAETVVVRPGDTLWVIATRELPHMDPREAVVVLRASNGVNGGELVAGQRLVLPSK